MRLACLGLTAVLLHGASAAAAPLQHDLFQRPALETLKPHAAEPVKTLKPPPPPPPPEWKPQLRAVIAGSGNAIVNVEGRILQMGQEIDGYRLVEVQERQATFVKDKVRFTLVLAPIKPADPAPTSTPAVAAAPSAAGIGSVKASEVLPGAASASPPPQSRNDANSARQKGG